MSIDGTARALFAQLGYDGCRDLREALRQCMAEHRAEMAAAREAEGHKPRTRASRKPTSSAIACAVMGSSESTVDRARFVERWRPDLVADVATAKISCWAAYKLAVTARDAAALAAAAYLQ